MKSTGRRESEVMAGVLAYLAMRGDVFFWRSNTSAGIARSGQYMRSGVKGTPDILCVKQGQLIGIEVKREHGGKVSADQVAWGANLFAAGGVYLIVRSPRELEDQLGTIGPKIELVKPQRVYAR